MEKKTPPPQQNKKKREIGKNSFQCLTSKIFTLVCKKGMCGYCSSNGKYFVIMLRLNFSVHGDWLYIIYYKSLHLYCL